MNSPTVARRALARILKQAREEASKTGAEAAKHAGINPGTLSRIENAETKVPPGTAMLLAKFYGASDEDCDLVVELAHAGRQRSWWQQYKTIPTWFDGYIGLEMEASEVLSYQPELIPGLLQTEDYARAMARVGITVQSDDEAEQHIAVRRTRQERLTADVPLRLHAVVNEASLHRRVGSNDVMRDQLTHLLDMAKRPNVDLQVLSFNVGEHPANAGAFTVLRFAKDPHARVELSDIVYVEYGTGSLYLEDTRVIDDFSRIFTGVREHALGPDESVLLIQQLRDNHY